MANEMIKFLRGSVANLPETATAGALYFTKDEGVYLGLEDGSYHRYGDFVMVDDVDSLPTTGAHETCMYYCTSENILARYDSTKGWVQINKQPTAAELKTLLGLGSAAYTDASAYDVAGAAAEVRSYVGDIPEGYTEETIVAYINKKAEETLNAASGGSSESAASVLAALNTYKSENDPKVTANTEAIATIKDGESIDSFADVETALNGKVGKEEGKSLISDDEIARLAAMSDGANKVEASETNGNIKIDGVETVVYTHPANHTIAEITGLQDALDGKQAAGDYATKAEAQGYADVKDEAIAAAKAAGDDAQADVDALAAKVGEVEEGKTVVEMIADAKSEATYDDTQVKADIKANADAIDAIEADYLKAADKTELANKIAANESAIELLTNGVSAEEVDGVNDLIQYVKDHGTEVTGMKADIAANAKAIEDQATSDAATYETKTDASAKLTESKEYADGLNTAMNTRVKVLEAIDHEAYKAADETVLANAKEYADGLAVNYDAAGSAAAVQETLDEYKTDNDAAVALKANAADVYTKEEVEGLLTWGSF